jgi:hypothetical protein
MSLSRSLGQDLAVAIDQDRDQVAEGFDALCNLPDLPSAMLLRIPRQGALRGQVEGRDDLPVEMGAGRNLTDASCRKTGGGQIIHSRVRRT